MRRILFDMIRSLVRAAPKGKSLIINVSLRILGTYYGGVINVQGFKFWIEHINALNRSLFFLGIYEPAMTVVIKEIVKPGMQVFDIGSNCGWYTLLMARCVGPEGKVYAFDIVPSLVRLLQKNLELNHLSNVVVTRSALGNQNTVVDFYDDQLSGTANLSDQLVKNKQLDSVPMIRFDDFVQSNQIQRIDFIKCDIDGAEGLFLEGAQQAMMKTPQMIMEIFDQAQRVFHSSGEELINKLRSYGYQLKNIDQKLKELTAADAVHYSSINALCIRP